MRRFIRFMVGLLAVVFPVRAQCEPAWLYGPDQSYPGVAGGTGAMLVHDDGTGPALYVGGNFDVAGDAVVNGIGRWDGAAWSPLADGLDGMVRSLAVHGGRLIAGGEFTSPSDPSIRNIAAWDGSAWRPLAEGLANQVVALADYKGVLYAAVHMGLLSNQDYVARWDGARWERMSAPYGPSVYLTSITVYQDELYVGGNFEYAGGNSSRNLARWDGSVWKPLAGAPGSIHAMCAYQGRLIVAGLMSKAGTVEARNIAAWDGRSWSRLDTGVFGPVYSLGVYRDLLLVGGIFNPPPGSGSQSDAIAVWNGTAWGDLPGGIRLYPFAMAVFQGQLMLGTTVETQERSGATIGAGIAAWDGAVWSNLTPGVDGRIRQLVVHEGEVYARGPLSRAGSVLGEASDGAQTFSWDGERWAWAGSIPSTTMISHQGELIFSVPIALFSSEVRRIDAGGTTRLGGVFNNAVTVLFSFGDEIIAAGEFTAVDGVPVNRVARWDGAAWQPMGNGVQAGVFALTSFRGELFAAGNAWIRRWDGTSWPAVSGAPNGPVQAMPVYQDTLVVAGRFDRVAASMVARSIGSWNGTRWSVLGAGLPQDESRAEVTSLAVVGDDLIVGGEFETTDTGAANIARWDGAAWHAMGRGTNARVDTLAVYNNELIVGGLFTIVDGRASAFWARWGCPGLGLEEPGVGADLGPIMKVLRPLMRESGRR